MHQNENVNWRLALLERDPFHLTPPQTPDDAVWVGCVRVKGQLERLFHEATTSHRTQVVLNVGASGSGKTHAAVCFGDVKRLPLASGQVKDVLILYFQIPVSSNHVSREFYSSIINSIGFDRLASEIQNTINRLGEQAALYQLQQSTQNETLGKALWLLGYDASKRPLLGQYFSGKLPRGRLGSLGLSRNMDSAHDCFLVLQGVLQCLIGLPLNEATRRRVIMWVDNAERLYRYPMQQYVPFVDGLRRLVDHLPTCFTLFVNTTDDRLDKTLLDRVTDVVFFQELNTDEAVEYVSGMLKLGRVKTAPEHIPPTYPFDETALRYLLSITPMRTPGHINRMCSKVITRAIQQGVISTRGVIDEETVRRLSMEGV